MWEGRLVSICEIDHTIYVLELAQKVGIEDCMSNLNNEDRLSAKLRRVSRQ